MIKKGWEIEVKQFFFHLVSVVRYHAVKKKVWKET
jgi:hypothetical protein